MSMSRNTVKDKTFNKADKKALVKYLEKYYSTQLDLFDYHERNLQVETNKTTAAKFDRRFRLQIKPVEMILYKLGSNLMSNVKQAPSIRKTNTLVARSNGVVYGKKKVVDNNDYRRGKRNS